MLWLMNSLKINTVRWTKLTRVVVILLHLIFFFSKGFLIFIEYFLRYFLWYKLVMFKCFNNELSIHKQECIKTGIFSRNIFRPPGVICVLTLGFGFRVHISIPFSFSFLNIIPILSLCLTIFLLSLYFSLNKICRRLMDICANRHFLL